jgi:hypothetical protein
MAVRPAMERLDRALQLLPDDAAIGATRVRLLLVDGRRDLAEATLVQLLKASPNDSQLWLLLSEIHAAKGQDSLPAALEAVNDGNGLKDYWTADISGLERLLVRDERLSLIPGHLVQADAAPLPEDKRLAKLETPPTRKSGRSQNREYLYQVLESDADGKRYAQDTDESGVAWRNRDRFAICAYPRGYGRTGRQTYVLVEDGHVRTVGLAVRISNATGLQIDNVRVTVLARPKAYREWGKENFSGHAAPCKGPQRFEQETHDPLMERIGDRQHLDASVGEFQQQIRLVLHSQVLDLGPLPLSRIEDGYFPRRVAPAGTRSPGRTIIGGGNAHVDWSPYPSAIRQGMSSWLVHGQLLGLGFRQCRLSLPERTSFRGAKSDMAA